MSEKLYRTGLWILEQPQVFTTNVTLTLFHLVKMKILHLSLLSETCYHPNDQHILEQILLHID